MPDKIVTYIAPDFTHMEAVDLTLSLIAAMSSLQFARYVETIKAHPFSKAEDVSREWLPAYKLIEWAKGSVDSLAYEGKEEGAKEALIEWAKSLIHINSIFKKNGGDAEKNLIDKVIAAGYVTYSEDMSRYIPDLEKIQAFVAKNKK